MSKFKTKPYPHQMKILQETWDKPYWALLMEMGTGKTKVTIDTACALYTKGEIDTLVVFAPKGVYMNWAERELPTHMWDSVPSETFAWHSPMRKMDERQLKCVETSEGLKIYVFNIESLVSTKPEKILEKIMKAGKTLLVVDESTTIKNGTAKRTKKVIKLGKLAAYRRILTGSPITNNPLDVYSQFNFLSPSVTGIPTFTAFKHTYAIIIDRVTSSNQRFEMITGYRNLEDLRDKIAVCSSRVLKEECLDLPPKIYQRISVEMSPEQKKAYNDMKELGVAELRGEATTASEKITVMLRQHQIVCGHMTSDEGVTQSIPNRRLSTLMATLEEVSGKAIIFATYRYDIKAIKEALDKEYGEGKTVTYFGDTSSEDRSRHIDDFQDGEARFFITNKAGAYGITLTAAKTMIYYSNDYSLDVRLQSEDRCHRIGQNSSVNYIDLVTPGTVDEKIINALREKKNIADQITNDPIIDWI